VNEFTGNAPGGGSPQRVRSAPAPGPSDAELVDLVLAGDRSKFQVLFDRYYRLVRMAIRNFVRLQEKTEDLCQDVFLKAFCHLGTLRKGAAFKPWILRIAFSTCVDDRRRRRPQESPFDPDVHGQIADSHDEPMTTGEDRRLLQAFERLRPLDGLILWLHYVEEMTFPELGSILDSSENSLRQRAFRALQTLRKDVS
jgi:RNA polymerase sigma-70 factor, ECF subfamily